MKTFQQYMSENAAVATGRIDPINQLMDYLGRVGWKLVKRMGNNNGEHYVLGKANATPGEQATVTAAANKLGLALTRFEPSVNGKPATALLIRPHVGSFSASDSDPSRRIFSSSNGANRSFEHYVAEKDAAQPTYGKQGEWVPFKNEVAGATSVVSPVKPGKDYQIEGDPKGSAREMKKGATYVKEKKS